MAWPKGQKHTKATKEKQSKAGFKRYSNPEARKRMSEIKLKQYRDNPKLIQKIDRVITAWWKEHQHVRKQRSEQVKQFFIKHPEKFKKFLSYGKNSSHIHLKTKQGYMVRSKGEKTIADFLHNNKIKSSYEQYTLLFPKEGQLCTPDFHLPKYKCFIEYYGGHPKSWKKKVMKNKLYKKHKIPCIFITPTELRNLNYYLFKDAKKIAASKAAKQFKISKWVVD